MKNVEAPEATQTTREPQSETLLVGEWPSHFPACCPPSDACSDERELFRFVESNQPSARDMESWLERGIGKGRECQRAALSCLESLQHAIEVRMASPNQKDKLIAQICFLPEQGVHKLTGGPGHMSLWFRRDYLARAGSLFVVVK